MPVLKGWRYVAVIGGLVGAIGIAIYPIIIDPMLNPDKYKKIQAVTRANIRQEDIQPGNMKVWTDPFDRKKS
ncbi:small integral membrane protein 20 [Anoplophora glabripennis]|uniref:small integral membrane protein 20 n=1 Tax=Anoplophora glabripennis TaxID=217634 RepID=UPI000874B98D|nr:small integral membrane protein 20 [Anoplophora glabripennis]